MSLDLGDLVAVEVADVYKGDALAGRLERSPEGVAFVYDAAYLGAGGRPVATTLPRREEPHLGRGGDVPPFFAGLLPEGRRLDALVAAVKTSVDDTLSLLLAVGGDTVGDVRVVPSGEAPSDPEPGVLVDELPSAHFEKLFARSLAAGTVERVGLAGVQAKVSAAILSLSVAGRGAHHILKLNPPEYPRLVENEAFFLDAARRCGVRAASAGIVHDRNGRTALLVERFDRVGARPARRLPQEDGCQVLDRYPGDKYRVRIADVLQALARECAAPAVGLRDGFAQVAFAYVIGNGDLHAKNLSIVEDPVTGLMGIAPAYDTLSTLPYDDPRLALPIGGRHENIQRSDMLALADAIGLRRRAAEDVLDRLAAGCAAVADDLEAIGLDQRRTHELRRAILDRRDELSSSRV